jgi:hypothetical protein
MPDPISGNEIVEEFPMKTSFPYMAIAKRFEYPYGFVLIAADRIEQGKPIFMPLDLRDAIKDAVLYERERRAVSGGGV